jgi:hypothetical protein
MLAVWGRKGSVSSGGLRGCSPQETAKEIHAYRAKELTSSKNNEKRAASTELFTSTPPGIKLFLIIFI